MTRETIPERDLPSIQKGPIRIPEPSSSGTGAANLQLVTSPEAGSIGGEKHRIGAIDVGSNSIHMIVIESHGRGYRIIDKEREMVQLARGSLGGQPLTREAIDAGVAALRRMGEIAARWGVDEIIAVGTSALREAPNREVFLDEVEELCGVQVRVITGEEEADFIYRAVRAAVDFHGHSFLCIDIGGGSVELIVGTEEEVFLTDSEPLGAIRLSERFFRGESPTTSQLEACRKYVRKMLKKVTGRINRLGFDECIGTSGTINALADLCGEATGEQAPVAGLRSLTRSALDSMVTRLAGMSAEERVAKLGVEPKRSNGVLAGGILLCEIMSRLGIKRLRACTVALREGIIERALEERAGIRSTGSVRRRSVMELAERSHIDVAHARHVAGLALLIFDQTAGIHCLYGAERELLEYAAMLHEIGLHVSYQGHHRHSYYLIRHAGMRGFSEDQISLLANISRYYRKAEPSEEHENFAVLLPSQRDTVLKLSAILRLAAALDRGRRQAVSDLRIDATRDHLVLTVYSRDDSRLELESGTRKAKTLARVFDREITLLAE